MKYLPFESRNRLYKSVFGACEDGQSVVFRVLLHRDARPSAVFMKIRDDFSHYKYLPMEQADWYDDFYCWFRITLPVTTGLYWYCFCYDSPFGRMEITRFKYGEGFVSPDGENWQLTVFKKDCAAPKTLENGIIYQIFPDRFFNSEKPKSLVPDDRFLRNDWGAVPEHRQSDEPCRMCNDYFGGDLQGICQKLDYLASLGVSHIYLNPVFEAHSNHRYNTADYFKIDPLLGTEEDLKFLCSQAKDRGISVILDGVFSHTGDDSIYFNKYNRYKSLGAYNSVGSQYYPWYKFEAWPERFRCWWGVPGLPEVDEENHDFSDFITGESGVAKHWLDCGISGWRLDVADELTDSFLDKFYASVKAKNPDAVIIGEVWEDASNKISYGIRRRYLLGGQLDSVMNYPFAQAIERFVKGGDAFDLMDTVLTICENYPRKCLKLLMNHIGTHDTGRILTVLAGEDPLGRGRDWQCHQKLSDQQRRHGLRLLRLAAVLQYTLPGIPSLYYGDEAGMEGYGDPFCRGCYPWGEEDCELVNFYKTLGQFRRDCSAFADGNFNPIFAGLGIICYSRSDENEEVLVAVNRWREPDFINLDDGWEACRVIFGEPPKNNRLYVNAFGFTVLSRTLRS